VPHAHKCAAIVEATVLVQPLHLQEMRAGTIVGGVT
jgi:hypothetical protein